MQVEPTMNLCPLSIAFLFLCLIITFAIGSNNPTHFTGDFSINCGSTGTSAAQNGREWLGDIQPNLSSLLQINGFSTTSTVIHKLTSADPVPHKTARISRSQFSYAFQVNPGQKVIRLHFNPTRYKGFKRFKDLFTVEAGPFILLRNFSASLTADALGVNSFVKEFCLNIQENKKLSITFSPESSQSLDTYAFINGVEIISVPDSLSYFHGGDIGLQVAGQKSLVYVDNSTALEIVQRIYIKQDPVPSFGDFDNMFPKWAMQKADKTQSNTWKILVEVGFRYLIRLHFSELGLKISGTGDVTFKVLINEMIAHTTSTDILNAKDQNNILLYRDYMVMMRGLKKDGKRDLLISLQSYDELIDGHGVLAGFEIIKLSNHDNSLASPNPSPLPQDSPFQTIQTFLPILGHRYAIANVAIAIICLVSIIVHKLREVWEASSSEEENKPSAMAGRLCRSFSLLEIQLATRNFNDGLLIGRGGFGKVYKGFIDKGRQTVAVKRLKSNSMQGAHEFLTEIKTLSELRHVNLVSLIGYCNEHGEMILVYDYMAGGTLADHLYKLPRESNNCSSLTWKQRLNICIGAGRGLDYLHTGNGVIHRDVKASNILLDENFVAKVSDFGLAKPEDRTTLQTHVSTKVKGTRGYLDPHYINTSKLTRKSDTYSFGVVLLEVLCGRPAVDFGVEDARYLPWWVRDKISEGEVDQIVDSSLREEISADSLKTFVGIAERCLYDEPKNRPTMLEVVQELEFSLKEPESKQLLVLNELDQSHVSDSCNDEIDQSINSRQPSTTFTFASPRARHSLEKQTNRSKATSHKQSRRRLWDSFWNRVKPSSKLSVGKVGTSSSKEDVTGGSAEGAERNKLVFFHGGGYSFDLEDLLRASAELLGKGNLGTSYKPVLEETVVLVKRLKDVAAAKTEFEQQMEVLGNIKHQNVLPLRAYYYSRDEKLLVHDYMPAGSLSALLHGSRGSGRTPLDWDSRLRIALSAARGLAHLHVSGNVVHGNIKSSNVLLKPGNVDACISDFGLNPLFSNSTPPNHRIMGYHAPEVLETRRVTFKSDVYSFGVFLLELLTGKAPNQASLGEEGIDLPRWVQSVVREEWTAEVFDVELMRYHNVEEEMVQLLQIGMACVATVPDQRPAMQEVLRIIEDMNRGDTDDGLRQSSDDVRGGSDSQTPPMESRASPPGFTP